MSMASRHLALPEALFTHDSTSFAVEAALRFMTVDCARSCMRNFWLSWFKFLCASLLKLIDAALFGFAPGHVSAIERNDNWRIAGRVWQHIGRPCVLASMGAGAKGSSVRCQRYTGAQADAVLRQLGSRLWLLARSPGELGAQHSCI